MATSNKNFKVKNGLDVDGNATASNFVVAGVGTLEVLPSKANNAGKVLTTDGSGLAWEEQSGAGTTASASPPEGPVLGQSWFDTTSGRLLVFYDGYWVEPSSNGFPGSTGFYIQPVQPSSNEPYVWWDTSVPGRPTLWIEDGA